MDTERIKMWMDMAKQFNQGQFWDSVFDADYAKSMMEQFGPAASAKKTGNEPFPRIDVYRSAHELIVLVDLPGVRKENIELYVSDGTLVLKGMAGRGYPDLEQVTSERYTGSFERSIPLPGRIPDAARISARWDSGLLEIRLPGPKPPPDKARTEKIPID